MAGYYPRTDGEKITWMTNFSMVLAPIAASLGLAPADTLAVTGALAAFQAAVADKVTKKAAAQSSTAACVTTDNATEDTIRSTVRRIKAHPTYTTAIGESLGIQAPESQPSGAESERPDLETVSVVNGEVVLSFLKVGHTGVEIRSKRGAETEYTFLARDTEAPYVDTRPNLSPAPETRYYVAQFLRRDTLVGQLSDVLVVTVPGAA